MNLTEKDWEKIELNKKLPSQQLAVYCKKLAGIIGFYFSENEKFQGDEYRWNTSGLLKSLNLKIKTSDREYYNQLAKNFGNDPNIRRLESEYELTSGYWKVNQKDSKFDFRNENTGESKKFSAYELKDKSKYSFLVDLLDKKLTTAKEKFPNLINFLEAPSFYAHLHYNEKLIIGDEVLNEIELMNSENQAKINEKRGNTFFKKLISWGKE